MTMPPTLQEIAARLEGYDPEAMDVDSVRRFLEALAPAPEHSEVLALGAALDRVLAQDLVSPIHVPAHDNSAMDGYAFAGSALQPGQGLRLRIAGSVHAGATWPRALQPGECLRIMTGAVMPAGADTVVPQELAALEEGGQLWIAPDLLQPGANRRRRGEDLQQGSLALACGERLTPAALGLLASLGLAEVRVFRRLRVAYFSTGDEILSPGAAPRPGAVYDSNRFTVCALLRRLGVEVIEGEPVGDDPALLEAALVRAALEADAVITSGGVSTGDADHLRPLLQRLGEVAFWRVAMRPGRPLAVGRLHGKPSPTLLFGLPGNPVAAMVAFVALVRPALLQMMGCRARPQPLLQAVSSETLRKRPGRTEYQRGIVSLGADGRLQVRTTGSQGSGVLSSMLQANGLIVLPHGQGTVQAGDLVRVLMFDGAF
ncbi:gephyrin-like molybdotransferase Glp [Comamonas endophytica]|uniref:Molybdopterin molybdenumtransferase n=1 Tax=Comamonas endophytica TaxID=2949090 RepID=A0ABY6GAS9_9BURK|nr:MULTISPECIES: gephyrin-like molybdotransferase Glp [unclassified Acidovorax]MCD2513856.1 molybdopterin molybdotransferase MoeA [Acidovorax sp. D4N7]UYG52145.1 molybdopterin molybdotransferase MoeA [Acidovorax sp. 5MLIR]